MKTALVMSGGSSKGAFTVGALEILRNKGVNFDIVAGTSTGALITPLVATDEIQLLKQIYLNVETKDILNRRGFLGIPFTMKSIFDTRPLEKLIERTITDERFERIMASSCQILIATTNLRSGKLMYWSNHVPSREQAGEGVHRITNIDTMRRALLASSNQPLFMPPIMVPDGGDLQVDGGVRDNTPLRIAIRSKAEAIYAIVVNPEDAIEKKANYDNMVTAGIRSLDLLHNEILFNDVDRAKVYNRAVTYLKAAKARASDLGLRDEQVDAIFDAYGDENPFDDKSVVELKIIRPDVNLPATNLEFVKVDMAQMMNIGRMMARRELGIIQPPEPEPVPA